MFLLSKKVKILFSILIFLIPLILIIFVAFKLIHDDISLENILFNKLYILITIIGVFSVIFSLIIIILLYKKYFKNNLLPIILTSFNLYQIILIICYYIFGIDRICKSIAYPIMLVSGLFMYILYLIKIPGILSFILFMLIHQIIFLSSTTIWFYKLNENSNKKNILLYVFINISILVYIINIYLGWVWLFLLFTPTG